MSYNVSVLGAGSWGTALAIVASEANHTCLWNHSSDVLDDIKYNKKNSRYLPGITIPNIDIEYNLLDALKNKDIIVIAIPSKFCEPIIKQLAPMIQENQIIVSATKGLELDPIRTMTDLMNDILPYKKAVVALSGPSHAEETASKLFTCLVAASTNKDAAATIQRCFSTSWTRVYTNDDPTGVQIGAAIKNIIAIAAGIVSAAKLGDNTLAALVTRGIAEMTRFGIAVGGNPTTFSGLTGLGDLIVTCYSAHSRNRYVGQQIVLGKNIEEIEKSMVQVPEGVRAVKQIHEYAKKHLISTPIIDAVYAILYEDLTIDELKKMLMQRPLTIENNQ